LKFSRVRKPPKSDERNIKNWCNRAIKSVTFTSKENVKKIGSFMQNTFMA